MRRMFLVLVVVLAAFSFPAATAQAQTQVPPEEAETACGPGGAGDELVPDSGGWFNFTAACANHDACYGAQLGQEYCDNRFRDDMYAHCATRVWYQRPPCYGTADFYYWAVREYGHYFY